MQWSIANSNNDKETAKKVGAPDAKALAELFGAGGPDEPTLMVQAMQLITSKDIPLDTKEVAFENFEMLIENLDNANNIGNLKLWPPLISQLSDREEKLRTYACSVIGTAVQNNPTSQEQLLKHPEVIKKLIGIAGESKNKESLRLKALYGLSNAIRHNDKFYQLFNDKKGWKLIEKQLKDPSEKVSVRVTSLLNSVLSTGVTADKAAHIKKLLPKDRAEELLSQYQ